MKIKGVLVLLLILFALYPLGVAFPENNEIITFSPEDQFGTPLLNSTVNFAIGGSYNSLNEKNGILNFYGLILDNYLLNFSNPHIDIAKGTVSGRDVLNYSSNNGDFSVLCNNCNITIQNYDILAMFVPRHGWLNYTVNGTGNQSFNLHYTSTIYQPINWTVYSNDEVVPSNMWSLSSDDWLTVSSSNSKVSIYYQMIDSRKDGLTSVPIDIIAFSVISGVILLIILLLVALLFKKKANH